MASTVQAGAVSLLAQIADYKVLLTVVSGV